MIPVYRPSLIGNEKQYVNECLDTGWISSKGEFVGRFESAFAKNTGLQYVTSVCNGTVALHLALDALGVGQGDEVIVPTLTYIASVNAILQVGAKPIYVDSLNETWQMDPKQIEQKLSPRTKAVMAVHLYGQACDMPTISKICEDHKLLLIEDCAEALGTRFNGRHVGTFADAATFSFFGNKTITTGEGGMVAFKAERHWERAASLKNQGVSKSKEYWHEGLAYNYRMTNICAAIGLAQLEQVDRFLSSKRKVANTYQTSLDDLPVIVHAEQVGTTHSYWMCSILTDTPSTRAHLRAHLWNHNIETRPVFPLCSDMEHAFASGNYPQARKLSDTGLNLPSYPSISQDELLAVCTTIRGFYE
ncbi:DegT/DnrJ/EryC1/StrS aminotransferase family protein [Luminiphilus sp.]|nr:DegT/DnrJ/EryC1/StrS aminotransferase family protein [Luminiphilus sp.]